MLSSYLRKGFIFSFLLAFGLISVSTVVGLQLGIQVPLDVANSTTQKLEHQSHEDTVLSIFANNVFLALISFLPVIGAIFCVYVSFNTGYVVGQIFKFYGLNTGQAVTMLFTDITTLIEYSSISLLVAESFLLMYLFFRKRGELKERLKTNTWLTVIIALCLLLLGAVHEYSVINH